MSDLLAERSARRRRGIAAGGEKASGATTEVGAPLRDCWSLLGLVLTPRDVTSYPVLGPVVAARSKTTIAIRWSSSVTSF